MTKYIFVTGGVVSSLGKGITASSIGKLLQARGLQVLQGPVFGRRARLAGAAAQSCQLLEEPH